VLAGKKANCEMISGPNIVSLRNFCVAMVMIVTFSSSAHSQALSLKPESLGQCQSLYTWLGGVAVLQERRGAARIAALKSASFTAYSLLYLARDGVVTGELAGRMQSQIAPTKRAVESDPKLAVVMEKQCDELHRQLTERTPSDAHLGGTRYEKLNAAMLRQLLATYGLR
jgi:hypothetical protein